MTTQRFIQLWTHRYHKYSHIAKAYFLGFTASLSFLIKRIFLPKGKQLIAIIRTEHFGDIVAAEPISRYVRSLYPDAWIVWFVKPVFRELVDYNPAFNQVFTEFCVTQRKVILASKVFHKVFELQFRNNNYCPKCDVYTENPEAQQRDINIHNYLEYGNLLEIFAQSGGLIPPKSAFPADDQPRIYTAERHIQKARSLNITKPYIVIHCQSNYAPKDWPVTSWRQLVSWLSENYDFDIVEIGLKSNLECKLENYRNLCGSLTLPETAEVIRGAEFFIGLDSGPSHFANATGTFGIILMGALNNFQSYNVYSGAYGRLENAVLVRQPGLLCAELPFEFVRERVEEVFLKRRV